MLSEAMRDARDSRGRRMIGWETGQNANVKSGSVWGDSTPPPAAVNQQSPSPLQAHPDTLCPEIRVAKLEARTICAFKFLFGR